MPKSRFLTVKVITSSSSTTPEEILRNNSRSIRSKFRAFKGSMKVIVSSNMEYRKPTEEGDFTYSYVSLNTNPVIFRQTDNIIQFMKRLKLAIDEA